MSEIALSFIKVDGVTRQTCVGCTEFLLSRGMVEVVAEVPLGVRNQPLGACCTRLYRIRYPFTLEGCRRAIKDRHVGRPWGE